MHLWNSGVLFLLYAIGIPDWAVRTAAVSNAIVKDDGAASLGPCSSPRVESLIISENTLYEYVLHKNANIVRF